MTEINEGQIAGAPGAPAIAYSQAGRGRDVVLIHGALVTRADMIMALFGVLSEGFRVTAFDRPGHGDSARLTNASPWEQAAQLQTAAQALGIQRPIVVGHSIGGAVALAYALQFPAETRGVVALTPICFPELRLEHLVFAPRATPIAGALLSQALAATSDQVLLPILWRAMFLPQETPPRFAAAFPFATAGRPSATEAEGLDAAWLNLGLVRNMAAAPGCEVPVCIIGAERDLVVNNRLHGALMAQLLPHGRYFELGGLGHMAHHFAQPRIRQAVEDLAR